MELTEQLMYACGEGQRFDRPERVVASPGVSEADVQEILARGPAQETPVPAAGDSVGLHFHPLPSGAFAVGRTTSAGRRLGTRGGPRVVTQCFVVPPRILARFANNPFALLRAAHAGGAVRTVEELPGRLEAVRLEGRTAVVDTALLRQLSLYPGPEWMAALVQSSLDSPSTAVVGSMQADYLIAGVINCLPPECRVEMSFSIGLRFSSRRPYRLVALSHDIEEQQRTARLYNVAMLDTSARPPAEFAPMGSWGGLIYRVLKTGRISYFAGQLARRPLDFSPRELPALGLQLLEELDASASEDESWLAESPDDEIGQENGDDSPSISDEAHEPGDVPEGTAADDRRQPGHDSR